MKKFFTLIELIVVIAVLGILAAIIIPNISSFQDEANKATIVSNVRNLQTGVDMYSMERKGDLPALTGEPTKYIPLPLNFIEMHPDYARTLPKNNGIKYWVDHWGKVWASTIDAPLNVKLTGSNLTWDSVEGADVYRVYRISSINNTGSINGYNTKLNFVKEVTGTQLSSLDQKFEYAVSAVDSDGFESAPAGSYYKGHEFFIQLDRTLNEPMFSLKFDGTNDYVDIPYSSLYQPSNKMSVEIWAYRNSWYSTPNSKFIGNTESSGYSIGIESNQVHAVAYIDGSYRRVIVPTSELYDGWNHFAMTFDGRDLELYINGELKGTYDHGTQSSIYYGYSNSLILGAEATSGTGTQSGFFFDGELREARIWNTVLSQKNINDNMYSELTDRAKGLVGYWKLDDSSGNIATDYSKNKNNGTVLGGTWMTK